jgi:folate-binding protein YgfZ
MTEHMNTWLHYLTQRSARLTEGSLPEVLDFSSATTQGGDHALPSNFVSPLTRLGMIAAAGDDVGTFLHNQLTNDVLQLSPDQARLTGYCSPKGRLLATMLSWKTADTVLLQLPREIQPAIQKRLQMFVLRAKVKLADVSDTHVVLGLGGPAASSLLPKWFPSMPATPYAKTDSDAGTLIRVADAAGMPRYQWIATPERAQEVWPELASALTPSGEYVWRLSEILAGVPQVTPPTQEQFVPQMINFELIGGVNFKKGCFPGQEIVARTQYLGKLKRRMLLASVPATGITAGTEVFSSADPTQPCGMVVNAERVSGQESACLVEVKLAAVDAGSVHLGSAEGPQLEFRPLPYSLTDPK